MNSSSSSQAPRKTCVDVQTKIEKDKDNNNNSDNDQNTNKKNMNSILLIVGIIGGIVVVVLSVVFLVKIVNPVSIFSFGSIISKRRGAIFYHPNTEQIPAVQAVKLDPEQQQNISEQIKKLAKEARAVLLFNDQDKNDPEYVNIQKQIEKLKKLQSI